jgi:serine/threonine protein kinase
MCIIKCFGITQEPITHNYALVLQYMENGNLRSYLANSITWEQRLNKIYDICLALNDIHKYGLIHKDLHPGNIFIGSTFAYIGDFGFCMPANENSTEKNVYGVIPYIAPEILRRKPHTLASDIYSLGIIINEVITGIPPFNKQPHDHLLLLDICRGFRPTIRAETPKTLKELIEKCWDANPKNRPTSEEIFYMLSNNLNEYKNVLVNFNETATMQFYDTHSQAIYKSRLLISQNLSSNLPEPINCPNQQEFIPSGKIIFIIFYIFIQNNKVNNFFFYCYYRKILYFKF